MRRCKAHGTTTTTQEEVVGHERDELDLVRSELNCHVRPDPPTHYLEFSNRKLQKLFANVAKEMALFTINQLIDVHLEIQHEAIRKFLNHSLVKDMVPPYLIDLGVIKHKYDVLHNMEKTSIHIWQVVENPN